MTSFWYVSFVFESFEIDIQVPDMTESKQKLKVDQ